jgi:hypothetical protein
MLMLKLPENRGVSKRRLFIVLGTIGLLIVAGICVYWLAQNRPVISSPAKQPTYEPNNTSKQDIPGNPGPATSDKVPSKEGLAITITQLEQQDNKVIITGMVSGATEGDCVAQFTTPNDKPVIGEAKATPDGAGAKCGPITLPAAGFAYLGDWQVVMSVYTGGGKAASAPKTITIK